MTRFGRLAATGLAAATLALAGGSVAEASSGALNPVTLQPSTAKPGSTVWIWGPECKGTSGKAASKAFVGGKVDLGFVHNMVGGSAKVAWVPAGNYAVKIWCCGKSYTGWLVVAPKGAPHTGDGASMLSSGGNVAAGSSLAAAGVGVGALALRRRRRALQSN